MEFILHFRLCFFWHSFIWSLLEVVIAMHCALPCYHPWGNAHLLTSSHHLLTKNPYGVITEQIRLGLPCSRRQNEFNLANEYHWVSLITHTNAMHKWSGFCPHKENGFSYASTCRFFWRFSVCTDDWELTVEWWVRFCWQLMKCVPDGLSVRTSCGWWKSDIESYINAISHRLLYISKIKSTEHLLHLYNSLNNKTLISSNFRFWHNLSVHQIFIYFFLWK